MRKIKMKRQPDEAWKLSGVFLIELISPFNFLSNLSGRMQITVYISVAFYVNVCVLSQGMDCRIKQI
jgi:hypothetical protein